MTLLQIIEQCANRTTPFSQGEAADLLSSMSSDQQARLISALYMGRNAINGTTFTSDDAPWANDQGLLQYTDHIKPEDYVGILSSKGMNTIVYFQKFLICARNAGLHL